MNAKTKHGGPVDVLAAAFWATGRNGTTGSSPVYCRREDAKAWCDRYNTEHPEMVAYAGPIEPIALYTGPTRAAVAELVEAASMLEKEFRRVYPIYYYAEPWAHETNVPLKSVKAALANVGHKS